MSTPNTSVFVFDGSARITSVLIDEAPWFVAMDVASALDYSDAEALTRRLDDDEKQNRRIVGFGPRGVTVISESGLYCAILGSRKPEAKKFRRWVTGEVLPSIRKTGQYRAKWMDARSEESGANKVMASAVQIIRHEQGKKTSFFHYANEHKLINWVMTGNHKGIDRSALSAEDLALRTHLVECNTILLSRHLSTEQRKAALRQYAMDWRLSHTAALEA